jgi:hypothetical protein
MRSSNAPTISAPLAVARAAGDAEPRGIDLRGGRLLERVDETADALESDRQQGGTPAANYATRRL